MFGREVRLPLHLQYGLRPQKFCRFDKEFIKTLRASLDNAYEKTCEHRNALHKRPKSCYDRNTRLCYYKVDDIVWLHQSTPRVGESEKLHRF